MGGGVRGVQAVAGGGGGGVRVCGLKPYLTPLPSGGDPHLGGDDWDALIVDWLKATHLRGSSLDTSSPLLTHRLRTLAEAAKVALSDAPEVALRMPVGGPKGGPLEVSHEGGLWGSVMRGASGGVS